MLCRNNQPFSSLLGVEISRMISRKGSSARQWDQDHRIMCHFNCEENLVDCWLPTSIIQSRCRSFTIVNVVFSASVVLGNYWVLSSDHPILFLSFHRDTVWDGRATDKNFQLEKSIATQNRTNYDLLLLTQFLLKWKSWTMVGFLSSRSF